MTPELEITEIQAKRLSDALERCLAILDESIEYVGSNCSGGAATAYRAAVGKVIADLYMNVLDAGIYQRFPHLRQRPAALSEFVPDTESLPPLDLVKVPLLHLLAEAMHEGRSNFISGLLRYEPIDPEAIDVELARRSGVTSRRSVTDWVEWYLNSGVLSDRDRQTLIMMAKNKKRYDAWERGEYNSAE